MWNAGLDEAQAEIKIAGRNISNFTYADDATLMAESEEGLKSLLMKVRGEWKSWLKTQHLKTKIMASSPISSVQFSLSVMSDCLWPHELQHTRPLSPITSWQIDGETMETVTDFTLRGSKITVDGDCSHEIKRCLLLGREAMTNLDSILKSRDVTLPTKVHLVKATVFPVVMYGFESWTIKKVECWRIDLLNCGIGEDSWESLELQRDPISPP